MSKENLQAATEIAKGLGMSEPDEGEKMNPARIYCVAAEVANSHGWQQWKVEADSEEEAIEKVSKGGGEFDCEEVEVTALGEFYISATPELEQ